MKNIKADSAGWIAEFEKQIHHRKHIILHGNIHDQFLWRGNYYRINEFLTNYFQYLEFPLILNFDRIDGFNFVNEQMRNQFNHLTQQRLNPNLSLSPTNFTPSPPPDINNNPLNPPPRRNPNAIVPQPHCQRIAPEEAFGNLRATVSQNKDAIASIIDLGDMLTTNPEHYGGEERNALILLKKCTLEAVVISRAFS